MIRTKHAIKRTAGLASLLLRHAPRRSVLPSACVLMYHRISTLGVIDRQLDDWNVTPASLDSHVASLVETSELVFVRELSSRLRQPISKPLVCLTFDDGYQNFHDEVLPILRRYGAKATVFVVTGCVGSSEPMPFDRWGIRHAASTPVPAWRPMDWRAIEECAQSGVVEIGGHSHWHHNAATVESNDVAEEPARCRQVLFERLGESHAMSYAYPYGSSRLGQVTPRYVDAVRRAGFQFAVTTDLGLARPTDDPYHYPRVEVHRSDSPAIVQAKVAGSLAPFFVTDRLRRAKR